MFNIKPIVGEAIKDLQKEGVNREDIFLVSIISSQALLKEFLLSSENIDYQTLELRLWGPS